MSVFSKGDRVKPNNKSIKLLKLMKFGWLRKEKSN